MSCAPCRRPWVVFGLRAKLFDEGAAEEFQLWKLAVNLEQHMAVLSCEDGNGNAVYRKEIEFTDLLYAPERKSLNEATEMAGCAGVKIRHLSSPLLFLA